MLVMQMVFVSEHFSSTVRESSLLTVTVPQPARRGPQRAVLLVWFLLYAIRLSPNPTCVPFHMEPSMRHIAGTNKIFDV